MDFIIELIAEILGEGAIEIIKCKKIPFIIRAIVFLMLSFIYLSIVGLMIYLTIKINSLISRIIIIIIALFLLSMYIYFIYKLVKDNQERK